MESKRPRSREKHVTGPAKTVQKRGQGLGTGPAGDTGGREQAGSSGAARSAGTRSGGGSVFSGWQSAANTGRLDSSVAPGAREKYTKLLGGGEDTATIMVYMCGTDLESRSGMGTANLQEMLDARFGGDITLLIYTGGCKAWKNSVVSSSANQIWQVKDGKLICLKENLGSVPMTDPDTLSGYIRWCAENYPASRYELILWDHGGGSVSGYGYDEKFASSGSMNLAGLDTALKSAGVKFDFIGFDACLMATAETALTMAQYADYLIASEETEPGVGWYYTDWLTAFGENTSLPTIQIGQHIADSFVDTCAPPTRWPCMPASWMSLPAKWPSGRLKVEPAEGYSKGCFSFLRAANSAIFSRIFTGSSRSREPSETFNTIHSGVREKILWRYENSQAPASSVKISPLSAVQLTLSSTWHISPP